MPVEWSGLGPELPLAVHRDTAEPLRAQLERQLRDGRPARAESPYLNGRQIC